MITRALFFSFLNMLMFIHPAVGSLHEAAWYGRKETVKALLKAGFNKEAEDINGSTPLHRAAENGRREVVELLLQAGAHKNAVNKNNETSLHVATQNGHIEIIMLLIGAGATTDVVSKYSRTPFSIATERGDTVALGVLYAAGAHKIALKKNGNHLLHTAAQRRHGLIVEMLLTAGIDKEAQDVRGDTPLHKAAQSLCNESVVEILLRAGAPFESKNRIGQTPLAKALTCYKGSARSQMNATIHLFLLMERGYTGSFSWETQGLLKKGKFDMVAFENIFKKSNELVKEHEGYHELIKLLEECGMPIVLATLTCEYHTWNRDVLINLFKKAASYLATELRSMHSLPLLL